MKSFLNFLSAIWMLIGFGSTPAVAPVPVSSNGSQRERPAKRQYGACELETLETRKSLSVGLQPTAQWVDSGYGTSNYVVTGTTKADTIAVSQAIVINPGNGLFQGVLTVVVDKKVFTTPVGPNDQVVINAKNGNDTITIGDTWANVSVNTGTGANKIALNTAARVEIQSMAMKLTVVDTSDASLMDYPNIHEIDVHRGNACITGADYPIWVNVSGTGNANINLGDGNDYVQVWDEGKATATLGDGNNNLYISSGCLNATMGAGDNVTVAYGGHLNVSGGDGNDTYTLGGVTLKATILGGAGDDTFNINDYNNMARNAVSIDGGDGNNTAYTAAGNWYYPNHVALYNVDQVIFTPAYTDPPVYIGDGGKG